MLRWLNNAIGNAVFAWEAVLDAYPNLAGVVMLLALAATFFGIAFVLFVGPCAKPLMDAPAWCMALR